MTLHVVRLGTRRVPGEGTRIGAVRRPPRGVRKNCYATDDWFDVWYPDLSPSLELMEQGKAATTDDEWGAFVRAFRREMNAPTPRRSLDLLAALSKQADFSIGCYCEHEGRCHRSVLHALLMERGASLG